MGVLYVTQQGAILRKESDRLQVTFKGEKILDVPILKVSGVVLLGNISVTSATLQLLLTQSIPVVYLTQHGRYVGRFECAFSKNVVLRKAQYQAAFDNERSLRIARQIVLGKMTNMRVLLQRQNRDNYKTALAESIRDIKRLEQSIPQASNLESLRGYEGAATASYFRAFKCFLNSEFDFDHRCKRPPKDPVNALLSFGYTLLCHDLHTACNIVGFDPYMGYLHADKYGKPALALDLMEEFRPLIVDSVVLTCINKKILQVKDFKTQVGGFCQLKDEARKKFLLQYEERKNTLFKHPILRMRVTYGQAFELQARILAKYLLGEILDYVPLKTR